MDFDEDTQEMIKETNTLVKENHKMLRTMRRNQNVSFIFKIIIWVFILAVPLYIYQQYLEPIISGFSATTNSTNTSSFLPSSVNVQKLLELYKISP